MRESFCFPKIQKGWNANMEENRTYENTCGCKHIKGIKCNVQNCYYHDMDTCCTATEISVGPRNASASGDTLCTTFKPKDC